MLKDLMNKTFAGQITEGVHTVILKKWTMVPSAKDPKNDYIRMDFILDDSHPYSRNMFERDMTMFLSHTRTQLGRATEDINPVEYINALVAEKTPLQAWITYPTVETRTGMRRVQNINWLEPIQKPKIDESTGEVIEDGEIPF